LREGEADVFSHVAPMLAEVQGALPDARILPGSYFNVPISIGVPKGRPAGVADFVRIAAQDMKLSGFVHGAIKRNAVVGLTVAP
jgi:hypothetical protein